MPTELNSRLLEILRSRVGSVSSDVVLVGWYVIAAAIAVVTGAVTGVARLAVGLPLAVFVPGYAFVTVLFPDGEVNRTETAKRRDLFSSRQRSGIDEIERVALSVGLSVAIVPLVSAALVVGPGLTFVSLAASLLGISAVGLVVGDVRRHRLPVDERYDPRLYARVVRRKSQALESPGAVDTALNVALACSVVVLVAAFGLAMFTPSNSAADTNIMLVTENETGKYVAGEYDREVTADEPTPLVLGIENQEGERVEYDIVIALQRVSTEGSDPVVKETKVLDTFEQSVSANEMEYVNHTVRPDMTGEPLRLTYLVYKEEPSSELSTDAAYRYAYRWVTVSEAGE